MMQKEIIVIGDVELGSGNLTDDFISDRALSTLLVSLGQKSHPVDLVMNGDTFDFLKCPFYKDGKATYPRHITKEISLMKLQNIYRAHERVFKAWKEFVSHPKNNLYFIVGNHDHELVYPEVQEDIKVLLGGTENIHFPGLVYKNNGVYVEHGHQYDFLHEINFDNLFLSYQGSSVLNFPWISFGLMTAFMDIKEEHPFLERITPKASLLNLHHLVLRKISVRSISYFFKSLLYYPFRYYSDPTYTRPNSLFGELLRRLKNRHFDVDEIMNVFLKRQKKVLPQYKIFVLGHIHQTYEKQKRDCVVIHPGSWRDEYNLDLKSKMLKPRLKHYVDIKISDKGLRYETKEYPIKRSIFSFDEVIKDERKYLELAAQEEGYSFPEPLNKR